jgi:hypothetical protein
VSASWRFMRITSLFVLATTVATDSTIPICTQAKRRDVTDAPGQIAERLVCFANTPGRCCAHTCGERDALGGGLALFARANCLSQATTQSVALTGWKYSYRVVLSVQVGPGSLPSVNP